MENRRNDLKHLPSGVTSPSFNYNDPVFDFKFDTLVDEDDPGFSSEFNDFESLFDSENDSDTQQDNDQESTSDEESEQDANTSKANLKAQFANLDTHMSNLTSQLQTEFLKQPKSTQMILTHEVSNLYKSYQDHGSMARLSAAVMSFLEGGDTVCRPAVRKTVEIELDEDGKKTGKKRTVDKHVLERAKLKFVPLPGVVGEDGGQAGSGNGKRKASDGGLQSDGKRTGGPAGGFGVIGEKVALGRGQNDPVESRVDGQQSDDGDRMEVDSQSEGQMRLGFSNIFNHQTSQTQGQNAASRFGNFMLRRRNPVPDSDPVQAPVRESTPAPILPRPPPPPTSTQPIPANPPQPTVAERELHKLYNITTDPETQHLLLGTNPVINFHPLDSFPLYPPDTPTPPAIPNIINKILHLHIHSAQHFHTSLITKYTLAPTIQFPHPPDPPIALFQLAIKSRLQSDLQYLFTPILSHPLAIPGEARALFRDVYGSIDGLNGLEAMMVARCTGTDEEAVGSWWEERDRERMAWNALMGWVERVEGWKVKEAKRSGRY